MGKPIVHEFGQSKTVLKFFPYEANTVLVPKTMASADANGNYIVKGGTPFPSNDASCVGYILEDIDVTQGDVPGACVYEGTLDNAKLTEAGITVSDEAKAATPRVTFFD